MASADSSASMPEERDEGSLRNLIDQARSGDGDALGRLLEHYREFLRRLAAQSIGEKLRVRVDDSDMVQQTLVSAVRNFHQFRGRDPGEFAAWLKLIQQRNLQDALRNHVAADKRSLGQEVSSVGWSGDAWSGPIDPAQLTPSRQAIRAESFVQLFQMLDRLPEDQRTAVRLRHLEGWKLLQIAAQLGRSEDAVAGLIKRGLKKLRELAAEEEERPHPD